MPGLLVAAAACAAAVSSIAPQAIAETNRFDALANVPFAENRPTPETARTLRDELLFQRATQAYLWALPLLNTLGMKVGSESIFGAGYNVLPIWKKRLDAKTLVTTPNSDVIYAMSYLDLGKDGPLVFEAPPNLQGILLDFWQRPIPVDGGKFYGDVGLPGPDGGKGGKFLLLPPGYKGDVPPGYYVYRSGTNNVFVFLRSFYQDPKDLTPAVALIEQSKIYPLNGKASAKPMQFPDASGVPANMLPRTMPRRLTSSSSYWTARVPISQKPIRWVCSRPSESRGVGRSHPMRTRGPSSIGPRRPRYKMSRVVGFEETANGGSLRVYADRRWVNPIDNVTPPGPRTERDLSWKNTAGNYLDLDARIWFFTNYYSVSPGMLSKIPGKGAAYMIAFTDGAGTPLSGGSSYRLTLPAGHSGRQFLVADAVRGREWLRPRQRAALSIAWFARQAAAEQGR